MSGAILLWAGAVCLIWLQSRASIEFTRTCAPGCSASSRAFVLLVVTGAAAVVSLAATLAVTAGVLGRFATDVDRPTGD